MKRYISLSVAVVLIMMSALPAHAGLNALGRVRLSWDEAGLVKALSAAPAQRFPLFVHLERVPDVRAVAIQLAWVSTFISCDTRSRAAGWKRAALSLRCRRSWVTRRSSRLSGTDGSVRRTSWRRPSGFRDEWPHKWYQ
jgi:hypothetical protein